MSIVKIIYKAYPEANTTTYLPHPGGFTMNGYEGVRRDYTWDRLIDYFKRNIPRERFTFVYNKPINKEDWL